MVAHDGGSERMLRHLAAAALAVVTGAWAGAFAQVLRPAERVWSGDIAEEDRRRIAQHEWDRALAHARLAATGGGAGPVGAEACPALSPVGPDLRRGKGGLRPYPSPRSQARPLARRNIAAASAASAEQVFREHVAVPIVQNRCVRCHVEGGASGHTRLVFIEEEAADHETRNLAAFREFLASVGGGADLMLHKIQGVAHGGGVQVPAGSPEFAFLERFLRLLDGSTGGSGRTPETLFEGVTMASPARTLRRAALVFAGRAPTAAELASVSSGREEHLRAAIRRLMADKGFHRFLIRGGNDRLLTDQWLDRTAYSPFGFPGLVEYVNQHHHLTKVAHERFEDDWQDPDYRAWKLGTNHGLARAPLELIAHVAENDLPYTEILTADYVMANAKTAGAYGAGTKFDDPGNPFEFQPSRIASYYRQDDSMVTEFHLNFGQNVINPGNLKTEWPHAGILNTFAFLQRYPTTPTNRNRARSRWTYYHFLGLDIEKSASRTTDPVALADTDNPTMKNAACTVCHSVLDPVAGAFQNYGENGAYRQAWGGLDSLDGLYKEGKGSPYVEGDTWYRDMRAPGFDGTAAPDAANSLQWLARRIAEDERFAEGTVRFWWPAVLGVPVSQPPEDQGDSDFAGRLLASNAQAAEVQRLAAAFREGIAGGRPYNLKDLLAEIALSPWFRAESLADADPVRVAALRDAGMERLLTPEELAWKTEALTGFMLGRWVSGEGVLHSELLESHRLLYGGIDSEGIIERSGDMTTVMAAVARSHAVEAGCAVAAREFFFLPDGQRMLFNGTDLHVTPVTDAVHDLAVTAEAEDGRDSRPEAVGFDATLRAGANTVRVAHANGYFKARELVLNRLVVRDQNGSVVHEPDLLAVEGLNCGWRDLENGTYKLKCDDDWLDVPVEVPSEGVYRIAVEGYQLAHGAEPAVLRVAVPSGGSTAAEDFEITAEDSDRPQTVVLTTSLGAGRGTVRLGLMNEYIAHRKLLLDRLTVRDRNGSVVQEFEFERLDTVPCSGVWATETHTLWNDDGCSLEIDVSIPSDGVYGITVEAYQEAAGSEPAVLRIMLESDDGASAGAIAVRRKLVELYDRLLGVTETVDSPEVEAAYRLFVDVWNQNLADADSTHYLWREEECRVAADHLFLSEVAPELLTTDESGGSDFNWDAFFEMERIRPFGDPQYIARTWAVVLSYLMADYRYLYF